MPSIVLWRGGSWDEGEFKSMLTLTTAWSELPKGLGIDILQISGFKNRNRCE